MQQQGRVELSAYRCSACCASAVSTGCTGWDKRCRACEPGLLLFNGTTHIAVLLAQLLVLSCPVDVNISKFDVLSSAHEQQQSIAVAPSCVSDCRCDVRLTMK
jgi:hypothetical protein